MEVGDLGGKSDASVWGSHSHMGASWVVRHNNSELSLGLGVMCVITHKVSEYSLKQPIRDWKCMCGAHIR